MLVPCLSFFYIVSSAFINHQSFSFFCGYFFPFVSSPFLPDLTLAPFLSLLPSFLPSSPAPFSNTVQVSNVVAS